MSFDLIYLIVIALCTTIIIYTIKGKMKKVFLILTILAVIFSILIFLFMSTYRYYSFSINETISNGYNEIAFSAPYFSRINGGYTIVVKPVGDHSGEFSLKGFILDKEKGSRYTFEGYLENNKIDKIQTGVYIQEDIKREGAVIVNINSDDSNVTYKFILGRIFP